MNSHPDSIRRGLGLLGLAALAGFGPAAATASPTGRPPFAGEPTWMAATTERHEVEAPGLDTTRTGEATPADGDEGVADRMDSDREQDAATDRNLLSNGVVIPEEKIDWGEGEWCEYGFCPDDWPDEAWSTGDWHFGEVGETHSASVFSLAGYRIFGEGFSGSVQLSVEPDDGMIGLSDRTVELAFDGAILSATFEVTLLKAPPSEGAKYAIRATAGNGWASITHPVTVGDPPVTRQFSVTLDAQGGTGGTASVTATYGAAMPAITVPSRANYTFGGYYSEPDGGGTQYYTADGAGDRVWDRTAATTLYAVWKPLAVATPVIAPADGSIFIDETCEVSIACATEGAVIYYTTDGTTPRIAEAFRYTAPFMLAGTATIKAVAAVDGLKSEYATATLTRRILTLAEAVGAPDFAFTTGGDADWKPVIDQLAANGFAAQSGGIPPNGTTWLEVTVSGSGTFLFAWKVDCEADDSGNATWDHLSASVDGEERLRIDGTTEWASVAFPLEGSGEHVVRWTFSKDGYDEGGATCSDRAWVSGVAWEPVNEPRPVAVAFDAHGGSCVVESGEYTAGEPYGELPEAVREGYSFAGWWTAETGGTRVGADTVADAATTVLHARWTADTYTVTLDRQGGTGGTAAARVTYGKELPGIGVPSLAGCVFGGYYSRAGGTGTQYYGADGQGTRTWDVAGDATLYAKWTEITHTQTVAGVKWFYAVSNGTAKVTGANPAEGRLEIPSKLGGYPVTDIGDRAFAGCVELEGVGIPGCVTNIGSGAFDCCGLTEVTIPDSVKCIGDWAFSWCEEMTNVVIGAGVAVIGAGAFEYCAALVAVTIPDGVTDLGARLFEGCRGLASVTAGNGVETIPDFAFGSCTALTNVVIGNSVTHIGFAAFAGCNGLEVLVVPCNVESVVGAFEYSLLKQLYVPAAWQGTDMLRNAMVPYGCAVVYGLSATVFTVPAGGVAAVSVPYANPVGADGSFKFGETGIAAGLPAGSAVYFWDEGKQKWGGGMKSAFGWDPAESNRVLLPGEGFCVRNGGAEAVEVAAAGEIPSDESMVRAYRGGGEWTFVAVPYPCGEDIHFGDTELAMQLGRGASVMFWDASAQSWNSYSKTAKGWSSAGASRVLGEGEAFFVQSAPDDADGTWTVWKPYDYP